MVILTLLIAIGLSIPLLVVGTQCLVALLFQTPVPNRIPSKPLGAFKILMPAHNESKIISATLSRLIPQLPDANPKNVILIADNCTDDTAPLARNFGVTVLERHNSEERGKGYALNYGIDHLRQSGDIPEVLIILDADCETFQSALVSLIETVKSTNLPAQMVYLMRTPASASVKQKIAGFAWLLKNKIRLQAMNALKLPVILTGTGMAFPWRIFDKIRLGNANIVEDMQLGIDCAVHGYPPVLCPDAYVYSDFPDQAVAEKTQRTRWEHGHLQTILTQVPRLAWAAVRQLDIGLFALALDIGVPPLSLLVMAAAAGLGFIFLAAWFIPATGALLWLAGSFVYFALTLGAIWRRQGQEILSGSELISIPIYMLQKLSIYSAFLAKRQKDWVRTERDH